MSDTAVLDPPPSAANPSAANPSAANPSAANPDPERADTDSEHAVPYPDGLTSPCGVHLPPAVANSVDLDEPLPAVSVPIDGRLLRFLGAHIEGVNVTERVDRALREYIEANPHLGVIDLAGTVEFDPEWLEEIDRNSKYRTQR